MKKVGTTTLRKIHIHSYLNEGIFIFAFTIQVTAEYEVCVDPETLLCQCFLSNLSC